MSVQTQNKNIVPEVILEFIEIAVHNILYYRKIYPDTIFIRRHKYGIIIHKLIHPELNNYINECMKAAHYLIKDNLLDKFVLSFNKPQNFNEEFFVFDIKDFKNIFASDPFLLQIEKNLRTFCLRLSACLDYLNPLPSDITFKIELHTTEKGSAKCQENPCFENFPWYEMPYVHMKGASMIPLQAIRTDYVKLQSYVVTKHLCDL